MKENNHHDHHHNHHNNNHHHHHHHHNHHNYHHHNHHHNYHHNHHHHLYKVMKELKEYNGLFIDVTWGAGGSTSTLTLDICKKAKDEIGVVPNMHLTCTNMEISTIEAALDECKSNGIKNILALRGDPPAGQQAWTAKEGGFTCAKDLVEYIKKTHGNSRIAFASDSF